MTYYSDDLEPQRRAATAKLRESLIAEGIIRPGEIPSTLARIELPGDVVVLRLDDAGRFAARKHLGQPDMDNVPTFQQQIGSPQRKRRRVA